MGVSHFGICISDLDRSLQFYCDVLGFRLLGRVDIGQDRETVEVVGRLLEIDDLDMTLAFIERDGVRIELLRFLPPASGGGKPPMNRIGFTHLSLKVLDFDAELDRMRKAGVVLLEDGIGFHAPSNARFAFVLDPDGNRIELFGALDETARKPWELFNPAD